MYARLALLLQNEPRNIQAAQGLQKYLQDKRTSCQRSFAPVSRTADYSIPAFIPSGKEQEEFRKLVSFLEQHPDATVAASSWGGVHFLTKIRKRFPEAVFMVIPPAPVTNSAAVNILAECGIDCCESWQELEKDAHKDIAKNSVIPVKAATRIPPLLVTRAKLIPGTLTDRDGKRFRIAPVPGEPLNGIYAMDENPVAVWLKSELK